jgi:hypothetical protein
MGNISKVKAVAGQGHFDGKFGRMFKFEYTMEDGAVLQANHKTAESFFAVGSEVEYDITRTHETYGNSGKVGKPQEEQYQNTEQQAPPQQAAPQQAAPPQQAPAAQPTGGRYNAGQADKNRAFALSYAKDLVVQTVKLWLQT